MALFQVEKTEHYLPQTGDQEIICSVVIGDGQQGSYTITVDADLKAVDHPARLGRRADLQNRTTFVTAHITDVLRETNWTSVTVTMQEAARLTTFGPYSFEVPQQNDEVDYFIEFTHS